MPEEDLETAELKDQIDEGVERAEAREERTMPTWTKLLSLSTAIVAVFAAVASLESGSNSNEAILEKSDAMLHQSRASDQWAFYQAKGMKAAIAAGQAELIGDAKPTLAATLRTDAARYTSEAETIQQRATALERDVTDDNERSQDLMEHHHRFAIAVTLLQIAIALSAIAALTRKKPLWFLGLAISGVGLVMFVTGFL